MLPSDTIIHNRYRIIYVVDERPGTTVYRGRDEQSGRLVLMAAIGCGDKGNGGPGAAGTRGTAGTGGASGSGGADTQAAQVGNLAHVARLPPAAFAVLPGAVPKALW